MIGWMKRLTEGGRRTPEVVHCPLCDPDGNRMKTATVSRDSELEIPLWHCLRCDRGGAWSR